MARGQTRGGRDRYGGYDQRAACAYREAREVPRSGLEHWHEAIGRHLCGEITLVRWFPETARVLDASQTAGGQPAAPVVDRLDLLVLR